jgi:hypothetical protein
MRHNSQYNKLGALALFILIPGCIWGSVKHDQVINKEVVKRIESRKTTRINILEWFGPPSVLAKKEGTTLFPTLDLNPEKMREFDSKVFFKYFLDRHALSEHHVVYYYFNEEEDISGISIPIIPSLLISLPATSTDLQISELWVLVNRTTGRVEDYVFLEWEKD